MSQLTSPGEKEGGARLGPVRRRYRKMGNTPAQVQLTGGPRWPRQAPARFVPSLMIGSLHMAVEGKTKTRRRTMDRRTFLQAGLTAFGAVAVAGDAWAIAPGVAGSIMTVTGPVAPEALGRMLPHEHVLVDFAGVDEVSPDRYDRRAVFDVVRPHLEALAAAGGQTLVECTPAYLGRDPVLLRRLSEATGVRMLTNTGYYGARGDRHIPKHAYEDSVDGLASRWIREWEEGIGETDVRPGFIKIGVDDGPLSGIDRKLVRAACRTHLATGLTIAAHTGPAEGAFEQLDMLAEEGVDPSAWIWVHAQAEEDVDRHLEAARRGAWVEFDGYRPEETDRYVAFATAMRERGLLHRVLLSQDNGWYSVGEPGGGEFRGYTPLFTDLVPALEAAGFAEQEIRQLLVTNPAEAFRIRVRAA